MVGPALYPQAPSARGLLGLFNVKEYGAVGDGVTDDSDAILSAIQAAAAFGGGADVWFPTPEAFYLCAPDLLEVPAGARVRLIGSGRGSCELRASAAGTFLVRFEHSHLRAEWYSGIRDMTLSANNLLITTLLDVSGATLFEAENIVLTGCDAALLATTATGTALRLLSVYDSHISNVYVEQIGSVATPAVLLDANPTGADECNANRIYDLHIEITDRVAVTFLELRGNGTNGITDNVIRDLKCHGDPATGNPTGPLVIIGATANLNQFDGGIIAYGRGTSQVAVLGSNNLFLGFDIGILTSAPPARAFDLQGARNRFAFQQFRNTAYTDSYYGNTGVAGVHNSIIDPFIGGGPRVIDYSKRNRVEYHHPVVGNYVRFAGDYFADLSTLGPNSTVASAGAMPVRTNNPNDVVQIDDPATGASIVFPFGAEPDTNYFVVLGVNDANGSAVASTRAYVQNRTVNGFDIVLEAAPGAGKTVFVAWMLVRPF